MSLEQRSIFDAIASEQLKREGMDKAAKNNPLLGAARQIARELAARLGTVNMDDVCWEMYRRGMDSRQLGNAAGSVFNGWQWTGEFVKSKRPESHSNLLRCWRLR